MTAFCLWGRLHSKATRCALALAFGWLAPSAAMAHPDYWVKIKYRLSFGNEVLAEINLDWQFDVFFSNQAFNRYDLDRDQAFSEQEAQALQAAIFDPMSEKGYFVRVLADETLQQMRLDTFAPRFDGDHLAVSFSLVPGAPLNYKQTPVVITTYDEGAYDFTLAESDFLTVAGTYDPDCRFRIEDGTGPLNGIPQTIALRCPE